MIELPTKVSEDYTLMIYNLEKIVDAGDTFFESQLYFLSDWGIRDIIVVLGPEVNYKGFDLRRYERRRIGIEDLIPKSDEKIGLKPNQVAVYTGKFPPSSLIINLASAPEGGLCLTLVQVPQDYKSQMR